MIRTALISVTDKTNLDILGKHLLENNVIIYSTGGTYKYLKEYCGDDNRIIQVSNLTQFPEIFEGRVKTLHPIIYGGILARRNNSADVETMKEHNIPFIDLVVCNLYKFEDIITKPDCTDDNAIEHIDIGGPSMIRAAAKNFKYVSVLINPEIYDDFIAMMKLGEIDMEARKYLAKIAFEHVANYDMNISKYFNNKELPETFLSKHQLITPLKYGINPNQNLAGIYANGQCPFKILNGKENLGYINVLDAINSWNLVYDLKQYKSCSVYTASFKHTSPAGVARGRALNQLECDWYGVDDSELTMVARSFILARYCDPKSSFGDFIAISDTVDECCAKLIKREVSDGIIAPNYTEEALNLLKSKKNGKYIILKASDKITQDNRNKNEFEVRQNHGITLIQQQNNILPFYNINIDSLVSDNKTINSSCIDDLVLANVTLKYTQSNSVSMAVNGQCVVAAGQQNRVDCTKLVGHKMKNILLRFHPNMMRIFQCFNDDLTRQQKVNGMYLLFDNVINNNEESLCDWITLFNTENHDEINELLINNMINPDYIKMNYISSSNLCLASDAFFPFEDNIDVAKTYNVSHIVQPGGSIRDKEIIDKVNKYGMTMMFTGYRLFLH